MRHHNRINKVAKNRVIELPSSGKSLEKLKGQRRGRKKNKKGKEKEKKEKKEKKKKRWRGRVITLWTIGASFQV